MNIPGKNDVAMLEALERRILWLASWTIHDANHIRPNIDGLKVGGHQSSRASAVTLMTALYLSVPHPWVKHLGVEHFGQSGSLPDLFRHYRIDANAILDVCAAALIGRAGVWTVSKAVT